MRRITNFLFLSIAIGAACVILIGAWPSVTHAQSCSCFCSPVPPFTCSCSCSASFSASVNVNVNFPNPLPVTISQTVNVYDAVAAGILNSINASVNSLTQAFNAYVTDLEDSARKGLAKANDAAGDYLNALTYQQDTVCPYYQKYYDIQKCQRAVNNYEQFAKNIIDNTKYNFTKGIAALNLDPLEKKKMERMLQLQVYSQPYAYDVEQFMNGVYGSDPYDLQPGTTLHGFNYFYNKRATFYQDMKQFFNATVQKNTDAMDAAAQAGNGALGVYVSPSYLMGQDGVTYPDPRSLSYIIMPDQLGEMARSMIKTPDQVYTATMFKAIEQEVIPAEVTTAQGLTLSGGTVGSRLAMMAADPGNAGNSGTYQYSLPGLELPGTVYTAPSCTVSALQSSVTLGMNDQSITIPLTITPKNGTYTGATVANTVPAVASATVSGSTLTVTPHTQGKTVLTITARVASGSNSTTCTATVTVTVVQSSVTACSLTASGVSFLGRNDLASQYPTTQGFSYAKDVPIAITLSNTQGKVNFDPALKYQLSASLGRATDPSLKNPMVGSASPIANIPVSANGTDGAATTRLTVNSVGSAFLTFNLTVQNAASQTLATCSGSAQIAVGSPCFASRCDGLQGTALPIHSCNGTRCVQQYCYYYVGGSNSYCFDVCPNIAGYEFNNTCGT